MLSLPFQSSRFFTCSPWAVCGLLVLACALVMPGQALAKKKKGKGHSSSRASSQMQRSGSEETRIERERRLTRECRGLPNAGACLGYARP